MKMNSVLLILLIIMLLFTKSDNLNKLPVPWNGSLQNKLVSVGGKLQSSLLKGGVGPVVCSALAATAATLFVKKYGKTALDFLKKRCRSIKKTIKNEIGYRMGEDPNIEFDEQACECQYIDRMNSKGEIRDIDGKLVHVRPTHFISRRTGKVRRSQWGMRDRTDLKLHNM